MKITLPIVLALAAIPLAIAGPSPPAGSVDVANFSFTDQTTGTLVTALPTGGAVKWTDTSGIHTVTADDGSFGSAPLQPGQSFTVTLSAQGVYQYHCAIHASMHGVIVVG